VQSGDLRRRAATARSAVCGPTALTLSEYNVASQCQQSPASLGGGLVKAEWFKRYRENERPEGFDCIVQSWDTANKAIELSDYSCAAVLDQNDSRI
jgi:phage terminase large subunit-like protein